MRPSLYTVTHASKNLAVRDSIVDTEPEQLMHDLLTPFKDTLGKLLQVGHCKSR